ncbi:MAG TPA: bifunctional 5,10-methylenetetrahydrofolate dehydrogenase/5,10-methenyltetrahydrofolate cyclohydrolase, partial [Candidatus Saccharibacteria bacterium]|nr:bifunctional 5,10-methylenetetrahydrofolate dehydrogenase/5,10-methenyltetrahydrofolate cyclohydrolase [Candidatus Saccharibacteria bacterium]
MKVLSGSELAGYIKERQAKQVRGLRQAYGVFPKLAIVQTIDDPVIATYVRLKRQYGSDILVDVEQHQCSEDDALALIDRLNGDASIHGIIVQLPLQDPSRTDQLLNRVDPKKDVDALGERAFYDPATPMAINWLLAGYNVELQGKNITIVGNGRLVGAPLAAMWRNSGYNVTVVDSSVEDLGVVLRSSDVVVTATGRPGLITSSMLHPDMVVVDAATASEDGKIVGDLAPEVRERHDLTLTPRKGGVGPLTV